MTNPWKNTRKACAIRAAAAACLGLLAGGILGPSPADAGELRYPALGNINLNQGTIEMWIMPRFDPMEPISGRFRGRGLFSLTRDRTTQVSLMWRASVSSAEGREGHRAAGFYPTGRIGGERYASYTGGWHVVGRHDRGWQAGEPRHIAFCWDGSRIWWIVDGKPTVETRQNLPFDFAVNEDMELVFGSRGESGFVLWDLRISSAPREPEETGFHFPDGAPADFRTLLLDRLDRPFEPDGARETEPVVMMPARGRRGGLPDGRTRFVETPRGWGLAL